MRTGRLRRRGLGLRVGYPTIRVVLGLVEGLEWRLEFKLRLHVHLTAVSSIIPSILSSKLSESRSMPSRWSTSRPNMSRDASVTGVIVLTTATICSRVAVREFRTQSEECFECLSLCVHSDMLSTRDIGLDDPHQLRNGARRPPLSVRGEAFRGMIVISSRAQNSSIDAYSS